MRPCERPPTGSMADMRVLIINTNREKSPHTIIPLGACSIASAASSAGHDVRFLDLTFEPSPESSVAHAVKIARPDVVGFSIRNIDNCDASRPEFYLDNVKQLVHACRTAGEPIIVLGGAAVTTAPDALLQFLEGDYAVVGEGEASFPRLLSVLGSGGDISSIPGIYSLARGVTDVPLKPVTHDLSSFPYPSPETWLDINRYQRYDTAMPIQTKRGCPFSCSYCVYPMLEGPGIRLRDPELVADDVMRAAGLGFRSAEFIDSVFNVPEDHAIACCDAISRLPVRVPLQTMEFNPYGSSIETISAMDRAGFISIGCTAESGSDTVLTALNKGFTVQELNRAATALRKTDALKLWIFMLCGPEETAQTVSETARFIESSLTPKDLVYLGCGVRILPGTGVHARAIAEGLVASDDNLLTPTFYQSPHISHERALSIIYSSKFPSSNIVSLSDGNNRLLPLAQRAARMLGLAPPYWRWAPVWNKARRMLHMR